MHIGIDARFYRSSTAGIGRYTRGLLHNLEKIDQKNQYTIFITPEDESEYDIKAKNFTKVVIPIVHYSLSEQTKFLSVLNKYKFDLVHFLNFNHPIFYARSFITTVHDLTMLLCPVGRSQKSFFRKLAFKKVMIHAVRGAKKVIAVSETTKKDIIKYLRAPAEKIKVIYEAADPSYAREISKSKCQMSNKFQNPNAKCQTNRITSYELRVTELFKKYKMQTPYLLFVSQWRPHKGLPELIKSFKILKSKYHIPHQLVITGKPNKEFPGIIRAIRESKFVDDIITPGFVADSDLPLLYQGAELFVFPSFYEGFGLGPLEAMACGVPVISSNLSCMPEILGDAAAYFDPRKIAEMADKINFVLINDNLRKKMKAKSLAQAKKYSWRKMAQETLNLYLSLEAPLGRSGIHKC